MLRRIFRPAHPEWPEPEIDIQEREHEGECAILAGLVKIYGPLPLPAPIPKLVRRRPKRFKLTWGR